MLVSLGIAAVSCVVGLIPSALLLWVAAKREKDTRHLQEGTALLSKLQQSAQECRKEIYSLQTNLESERKELKELQKTKAEVSRSLSTKSWELALSLHPHCNTTVLSTVTVIAKTAERDFPAGYYFRITYLTPATVSIPESTITLIEGVTAAGLAEFAKTVEPKLQWREIAANKSDRVYTTVPVSVFTCPPFSPRESK